MNSSALILLISLLPLNLLAFTLNTNIEAYFEQDRVKVNVAENSCDNLGKTPEEILDLAEQAVDIFWNTVSTSRLRLVRGSVVSLSSDFKTEVACTNDTSDGTCIPNDALKVDQDILIACNNETGQNFTSTSILGLTVNNNVTPPYIRGSLFLLNDIPGTKLADYSDDEWISILAHEIGHGIGLGHTPNEWALMYYLKMENRVALGQDDIDGMSYLYPKSQPLGCGTIAPVTNQGPPTYLSALFLGFALAAFMRFIPLRGFYV